MSNEQRPSTPRLCRCGQVTIPDDWRGVETATAAGIRYHYFDRCSEPMIVYDEVRDISPEVWTALGNRT